MLKCRQLICKFLSWDVGKGDEALFWEDSWDGYPPLDQSCILVDLKDTLINMWGNKVCDYKTLVYVDGTPKWVWKSLEGLGMETDLVKVYQKLLEDRRIKPSDKKDELIWVASNDGK